MKRLIFLLGLSFFLSCGKESSTPTTPTIPTCERNNTAVIQFQNRSARNLTYDIIWDGSKAMTLAPNQNGDLTVSAGTHTLLFRVSNTSITACAQSSPNLARCSTQAIACSY